MPIAGDKIIMLKMNRKTTTVIKIHEVLLLPVDSVTMKPSFPPEGSLKFESVSY